VFCLGFDCGCWFFFSTVTRSCTPYLLYVYKKFHVLDVCCESYLLYFKT